MEGADAATRGNVIHDVLQDALGPLIETGQPLNSNTLHEALVRLRTNGRVIWNEAPHKWSFGRSALWRLDAENTLRQVEMLLDREARRSEELGVTHIMGAEKEIAASLPLDPPLRVAARIDRLDAGENFVVIVDYKSGREVPEADVLQGRRVQLQLYGHLGRHEAQAERVVARYAWVRPDVRQWELDSSDAKDAEALDSILSIAQTVRASVESGDFQVNPQVPTCPSYCSMRHVCRVSQFSRWKTW